MSSNLLGLEEPRPVDPAYENVPSGPDPELETRVRRGANWFYWIAGLSVINSVAYIAGAQFHFLAGLGITEVADAITDELIQQGMPTGFRAFAIVFDLIAVIGFALCGYFANKLIRTVFIIGIACYFIDGLIVLLLGDLFMAGFHAFALYGLVRGYLACRELKAQISAADRSNFSPPPPSAMNV